MTNNQKENREEKSKWFIKSIFIWFGNKIFNYNYQIANKKITKINENIFNEAFNSLSSKIGNYTILLQKLIPVFNITLEEFRDNEKTGKMKRSFDKDSDIECMGGVSKKFILEKVADNFIINNFEFFKNTTDTIKNNLSGFQSVYSNSIKTETPLVCGLGATHVLETALTLHHIWGVPYIPASSLKGVCRQAAFWNLAEEKNTVENELNSFQNKFYGDLVVGDEKILTYQLLFGAQDFKGLLLFIDAYPECENNQKIFKLDVMNPHYSKYYGDDEGRTPPADWENPTPIFFLTVKEGVEFRFVVLFDNWRWEKIKGREVIVNNKKVNIDTNVSSEINKILSNNNFFEKILKQALTFYGVGSKTRLGYGNFEV